MTSAKSSDARDESSAASAPSSKPPQPAKAPASTSTWSKPDYLVVAQVLSPHGIRGELKCRIVTDFPKQRFKRGSSVLARGQTHTIEGARVQGTTVLLKLSGVPDRNAADSLRGADIEVPTEAAVRLPKGQFYWHQVIGLQVEDATTHTSLGQVRDILETGANDVYIVRTAQGKELLIPAIKEVVKEIDPAAGRILIEPLPGLIPPPPP